MNGWQRRLIPEPEQGPQISPEHLERLMVEHLKALDARQDEIYERIQATRATSRK